MNALLSFGYALLMQDCASAAAGVGLDPAVGFLHEDRPAACASRSTDGGAASPCRGSADARPGESWATGANDFPWRSPPAVFA